MFCTWTCQERHEEEKEGKTQDESVIRASEDLSEDMSYCSGTGCVLSPHYQSHEAFDAACRANQIGVNSKWMGAPV